MTERSERSEDEAPRLRRRDLVTLLSRALTLDRPTADRLLGEIEEVIERNAGRHGLFARLPRVGSVERRPAGFPGYIPLTFIGIEVELETFTQEIARTSGVEAAQVDKALRTVSAAIDGAPPGAAAYIPGWGYDGSEEALDSIRRERRASLVEHYWASEADAWVLQCNPARWDLLAFLEEMGDLPDLWPVSRYRDDISAGDSVVFWLSGSEAGAYAIGEVLGTPYRSSVDERYDLGRSPAWEWFVPIDLDLDFFDAPVLRSSLKDHEVFADETIIRAPMGGNPHPLTRAGFRFLLDRVRKGSR